MFRIRSVSCAEMQCSTPQCKNLPVSLVSNSEKAHESASEVIYKVTMTTDEGNNSSDLWHFPILAHRRVMDLFVSCRCNVHCVYYYVRKDAEKGLCACLLSTEGLKPLRVRAIKS